MSSDAPSAEKRPKADAGADLRRIGKYLIQRQLGVGGMGTVYLAVDDDLKRTVALKVLPRERAENPTLVRRFKSEGQAAALLHHRNIVSVYEAGQADGYLFLALEYVDGIDVLEWIRKRGPLPVKRSIEIIKQTTEALQHACERNIVHRDIKPSNLMIAKDGNVKLTDMGLARSIDDTLDTTITRDGTTVGTVDYMAPEQASDSKAADIRSDIYSLGCTWFHMLTGSPPYPEGSVTNKLTAHVTKPPPDPRDGNPHIPEAVVAVLHRMMAKKKEARYQTPAELLEDLTSDVITRGGDPANLLAMLEEDWEDSGSVEIDSDGPVSESQAGAGPETGFSEEFSSEEGSAEGTDEETEEHGAEQGSPPAQGRKRKWGDRQERTRGKTRALPARRDEEQESDLPASSTGTTRTTGTGSRQIRTEKQQQSHSQKQQQGYGQSQKQGQKSPPAKLSRSQPVRQIPKEGAAPVPDPGKTPPRKQKKPSKDKLRRKGISETPVGGESESPPVSTNVRQLLMGTLLMAVIVGTAWWGIQYWTGSQPVLSPVTPYGTGGTQAAGPDESGGSGKDEIEAEPEAETEESRLVIRDVTKRDLPLFPGTGDLDGSPELASILPEWLRSDWLRPPLESLSRLQVARGGGGEGGRSGRRNVVGTLSAALERLEAQGAEVEISGVGPWTAPPALLEKVDRLVIRPKAETSPVISIAADELGETGNWLTFTGGRLELEGLHFVISRTREAGTAAVRLLAVRNADVLLRNCTFTVLGEGPVEILTIQGDAADGNRILIQNCLMRGRQLTAVRLDQAGCDLLIGNSLLASEEAPLFQMASARGGDQTLRLLGSTLLSGRSAFELTHPHTSAPPPCRFELRRSLLISRDGNTAPVFDFRNWPRSGAEQDRPRPERVTLNATHVRILGFQNLSRLSGPGGEPLLANDAATWEQFWKKGFPSDDLLPDPQPGAQLDSVVGLTARELDLAYGELARPGAGPRALLGSDPDSLPIPPEPLIRRIQIVAGRPRLPGGFGDWKPSKTVRFDLRRSEKLAEFLGGPDCPDGTHVICFGSGLRFLSVLELKNRRLRIEFEQSEGTPLRLQPQADTDASAWITLEGGRVDLVNGNFELPDSTRRKYPPTFLKTLGRAEFSLRDSNVIGPASAPVGAPLFDMSAPEEDEQNAPPVFATISNSFLSAQGPVLRANLAGRSVQVDNSILASRTRGVALSGGGKGGDLLLHFCTLTSSRSVVDFTSGQAGAPVDLFLKNVVFAPPVEGAAESTVLSIDEPGSIPQRLRWWESGCGYARQLGSLMRVGDRVLAESATSGWNSRWPEGHLLDPLHGAQGVMLSSVLPERQKLSAANFELQPDCRAAAWAEDGGAIGADVTTVGPNLEPVRPESPGKSSPPPRKPRPGPPRPDF